MKIILIIAINFTGAFGHKSIGDRAFFGKVVRIIFTASHCTTV